MNIKKPFKVLTTATLIGSLSLSAVAPGSALAADQVKNTVNVKAENAYTPTKVILENEKGEKLSLSYDDYLTEVILSGATETEQLKVLNGYTLSHFVTEAGTFDAMTYLSALEKASKEDTVETILEGIKKAGEDVAEPKDYKEGSLTDGTLDPVDDNTDNIDVVEISAINNTVTVGAEYTLPGVVTAKLKNGSTKELAVTWDGKIDTSAPGTQTIKGTVEGTDIKAELTVQVKYADTGLAGFAYLDSSVFQQNAVGQVTSAATPAEGAEIYVNGKKQSQTVQANGAFNLDINPGSVEVKLKKEGYFTRTVNTNVSQNTVSATVATLREVDEDKLYISGVVKDAKGVASKGAQVEIYSEDGKTKLGTATTDASGKYVFGNKGVDATVDSVTTTPFQNAKGVDINAIDIGEKYVLKVSKPLSEDNLNDVYKELTQTITTSEEEEGTNVQTRFTTKEQVAEIKNVKFDLSWATDATSKVGSSNKATVTLYTNEGLTKVSDNAELAKNTEVKLNPSEKDATKAAINLVGTGKVLGEKPTLPTGSYYVKIDDGANAIKIYTLKVTEGTDASASVEITKAVDYNVSSTITDFKYVDSLLADGEKPGGDKLATTASTSEELTQINAGVVDSNNSISRSSDTVTASYVTKYVAEDGTLIPFDTKSGDYEYKLDASSNQSILSTASFARLEAKATYQTKLTSNYVTGNTEVKKTIENELATGLFNDVKTAGKLAADIDFNTIANGRDVDESGTKTTGDYVQEIPTLKDIDLVLTNTATGEETKLNALDAYRALDNTTRNADDDTTIAQAEAAHSGFLPTFTNVAPGQYKLTVKAKGYEAKTSEKAFRILDFQNQEEALTVDAEAPTKLTGSLQFADNDANVLNADAGAEATILAYELDADGKPTGNYVAGQDLGTGNTDDYAFADVLEAGKSYRLVVRGAGFETLTKDVTIKAGNNVQDLKVERGGNAQASLTVTDSNKQVFATDPGAYVIDPEYLAEFGRDENGDLIGNAATADANNDEQLSREEYATFVGLEKAAATVAGLTYTGVYELNQKSNGSKTFETDKALSVGEYQLLINAGTTKSDTLFYDSAAKDKNLKVTYTGQKLLGEVTVDNEGQEQGEIVYTVEGNLLNIPAGYADTADTNAVEELVVAAYDSKGDLVKVVSATGNDAATDDKLAYKIALPNGSYTLKAFANGSLVGEQVIAVQSADVKNKNFGLSLAD